MELYTQTHTHVNTNSLVTGNYMDWYHLGMTLAKRLKDKMDAKELNPYSLSKLCGVPQPTISRIMKGKHLEPRRSTLAKIAAHLDTTVEELSDGETNHELAAEFSSIFEASNEEGKVFLRSALKVARIQYGSKQKLMHKKV